MTQIASISAYIRIFFEYLREQSDDTALPRYSWEATNTLVSNINALRRDKGKLLLMFNEEFTILSSASVMIYFVSAGLNIATIYKSATVSSLIYNLVTVLYLFFAILAIIMVVIIHRSSCTKRNLIEKSPIYIEAYIHRAVEFGLLNSNQVEKAWKKLNPDNRIHRSDGTEIS